MKGEYPHKAAVNVCREDILRLNQTQRLVPLRGHAHPHSESLRYGNQEVLLAEGVKPEKRQSVLVLTNQIDYLLSRYLLQEREKQL